MPQPESCCSDCRIIGFSACSSSCRSVTGSEATQPSTRHMGGVYSHSRLRGGRIRRFRALSPSKAERRELKMVEPKRIWWARPKKLCALERPGGGGRSHRPERREADIAYLKGNGVRLVISTMTTRHNLGDYEVGGLSWLHVPVPSCDEGGEKLDELLGILRR